MLDRLLGTSPHIQPKEAGNTGRAQCPTNRDDSVANAAPGDSPANLMVASARREFVGAFGDLARGKRNWQLTTFALGAVVVLQAATTFRLSTVAHPVPYVVQIDRLGNVAAVGAAEQARTPDTRLVASQLAAFVRAVRSVLPSIAATAQADLLRRGYAFAAPNAAGFLNAYFGDPSHDPRLLGSRLARDVRVTSALRVPDPSSGSTARTEHGSETWRLQWIEIDRPLSAGDSADVAAWEGYFTVQIVPPTTVETIQDNPLGVRVVSIAWTRVNGQVVPRDSLDVLTSSSRAGGME
ncbi:MAG: VirB8/TrbF family protein [Gemmatimonadaceae bacterium]